MGRLRKKNQQGYLRADIFFMFLLLSILIPLNASTQSPGKIRLNTTPDPDVLEFYTGSNWIPMNASDTAVSCTGFYSKIRLNTTPTPDRVEYCNGTNWISMEAYISNDVCTELGRIELHSSSNSVRYCNGSNWVHTGGAWVTVFITSGTNWTVPDDWDSSQNLIHVIGGGGGSGDPTVGGGSGGGGGAYSRVANLTLTPSATIDIQVGAGGAENSAGTDTFFNGTTCGGSSACAVGGGGASGSNQTVGTGGAAASGVGDVKYSGGDGGSGGTTSNDGAGGGGGAAGPDGDGENGGGAGTTARGGGGGGAGGTSSTAGSDQASSDGGPGGHGPDGTGGGAGGTGGGDGAAGTAGGGGGGGDNGGGNGGAGSMYEAWTQTSDDAKAGPGGGSGGAARNSPGVAGASYGAGAGGPGEDGGDGAAGGPGLIVVQYYSVNAANSGGGSYDTEVTLTSGTSWTVPNDWNDSDNSIECIGAGGGGARGGTDFANNPGSGGGGGGYSAVTNVTLTPGTTVGIQIGAGGAGATTNSTAGNAGTDSYFCNDTSNCANIGGSAVIVGAKGGGAGLVKSTGGAGGAAASGVGTTKYTGGNGGSTAGGADGGGGGGGAAGPNGDGGSGGDITSSGGGGTGGGGNGGGADAGPNTGNNASMGANNFSGSGGGASAGAAGTNGGGGAGGNDSAIAAPYDGGAGGNGDEWGTSGSGGGGGGGGWVNGGEPGGNGGLYGAGGGGGSPGGNNGGNGANGICVVRYNAANPYDTEVTLTSGTSWTVPNDWNDSNNIIECIGGGGKGQGGQGCGGSDGGGGGGYSAVTNTTLTPGASVTMMIGSAGTTGSVDGGDSYFCNSTSNCASIAGSAVIVGAKGGLGGANGRTGGLAASGIGGTKYSGGTGGAASDCGGAGGGGAAGPLGDGGAGGGTNWDGAGGGGGNGGGSAGGTVVSSTDGGDGGNNNGGSGGGAGGSGSTPGANGTNGGGGGGGTNGGAGNMGGTGSNGTDINGTVGSGGGGGGSGTDGTVGAAAGNYGGGGGGSADNGGVNDGGDGAPGICVIRYQASGSSTGLIGRWPLDDTTGTTVVETVSGNNGTWQDTAVVSVPGKISTGLDFDGTSSNRVHNADDAYDNLTAMTVCTWFKMDGFVAQFPDLVAKTNGSGANGWMFYVNDPGNAIGLQTNKDDWAESAGAYYNSEHGDWVHACATWDGSDGVGGIKVYKNGEEWTINSSGTGAGDFDDSANDVKIGGSGTSHYDGTLDDVRIYNRVLTAAEIQDIFNGADADSTSDPHIDDVVLLFQPDADDTTPEDLSLSAHALTLNNGATLSTAVTDPFGGSNKILALDGNDDSVYAADSDDWYFDGDFTQEFWVRFGADQSTSQSVISAQESGSSVQSTMFSNDSNDGLKFYGEVPGYTIDQGSDAAFVANQWHHVAFVRQGNTFMVYLDGTEVVNGSNAVTLGNLTGTFNFGGSGFAGQSLDGYIGAARVTKGVARYTSDFTAPTAAFPTPAGGDGNVDTLDSSWIDTTGLIAYFKMDDSPANNGATIVDSSPNGADHSSSFTTNNGATDKSTTGKLDQAITFDGSGDEVAIAGHSDFNFGTGDFSFSMWVKLNAGMGSCEGAFGDFDNGWPDAGIEFCGAGVASFWMADHLGNTGQIDNSRNIDDGVWHHIVGVKSGTTGTLYIDGVEEATASGFTGNFDLSNGPGLGYHDAGSGSFDGELDEVSIWNRALSPVEISKIFAKGNVAGNSNGCPTNYVSVPADGIYTGQGFCVAKYEMKNVGGVATSQAASVPWFNINQTNAESECQALGAGYDLMSNAQWQTLARNIESVAWNWDTGVVGGGNGLSTGHTDTSPNNALAADTDDDAACTGTGQTCSGSTWNAQRRTHKLTTGEIIWDTGGNLSEWMKDTISQNYGTNTQASQVGPTYGTQQILGYPKEAFGPQGDYSSFNSGAYGGIGYFSINTTMNGANRGGYYAGSTTSGLFDVYLNVTQSSGYTGTGFRCVYTPAPVAAADDVAWDKVVLLIQPGTSDTVIDDLSSLDHTFSFNNDAAFSTAISDPFGGSNKVIAMDGTGDYLNSADSDGWHLDGDFTWEFWMNWNSMTTSERATFTWQYQDGSNNGGLWLDNGAVNNGLIFTHTGISDLPEGADHTASTGNWHHYALTRSGEDIRVFFNGTELSSTASQVAFANLAGNFYIGADGGGASSTWSANGYFGPIRFTKGVSHYHGNFIPPTNPFPTAATEPTASVTFDDATGEYMSKTFSNAGNRKTWTLSTWFKRDNNSSDYENFLAGDNGGSGAAVGISPSNHLELWDESQQGGTAVVQTTTTITDTSWHHLVVVLDTTQSTAADRVKIYLDGTRLTAFNINHIANFAQDENGDMNRAAAHYVGRVSWGAAEFFDGKLSEYHFIDGLALDPSHFGYDNNGTWTPKTYGGGYGTNGFYLFGNGFSENAIGTDQSGNGNDLTLTNMDSSNRNADGPP